MATNSQVAMLARSLQLVVIDFLLKE